MKVVRLSASHTGCLYPQKMYLVLIFTRGWVDPRAMVCSEGNMSLKNPLTPPGIDPGTVRLVAQRLNHYATPGHHINYVLIINHYGRSKRQLCLRRGAVAASLQELRVWIPPEAWMFVSCECRFLSGKVLCDEPIPRPEESDRLCVSLSVISCNKNPQHLQWVVRRGQTKKVRINHKNKIKRHNISFLPVPVAARSKA